MQYDQHAADYNYGPQSPPSVPGRFLLARVFKTEPPEVLALLEQQYSVEFRGKEEVECENGELEVPEVVGRGCACFVEDKEGEGGDVLGEDVVGVDVDVEFCVFFAELVEEERHDEQEVHGDDEGVQVLVVDDDADQEGEQVDHAEVGEVAYAVGGDGEVEGIFEF